MFGKGGLAIFPSTWKFFIGKNSMIWVEASSMRSTRLAIISNKVTVFKRTGKLFPLMYFLTVFNQAIERWRNRETTPRTSAEDFAIFYRLKLSTSTSWTKSATNVNHPVLIPIQSSLFSYKTSASESRNPSLRIWSINAFGILSFLTFLASDFLDFCDGIISGTFILTVSSIWVKLI